MPSTDDQLSTFISHATFFYTHSHQEMGMADQEKYDEAKFVLNYFTKGLSGEGKEEEEEGGRHEGALKRCGLLGFDFDNANVRGIPIDDGAADKFGKLSHTV